jgi:hypothetical protein
MMFSDRGTECLAYCILELYLGDLPWRYNLDSAKERASKLAKQVSESQVDRRLYGGFRARCECYEICCSDFLDFKTT